MKLPLRNIRIRIRTINEDMDGLRKSSWEFGGRKPYIVLGFFISTMRQELRSSADSYVEGEARQGQNKVCTLKRKSTELITDIERPIL